MFNIPPPGPELPDRDETYDVPFGNIRRAQTLPKDSNTPKASKHTRSHTLKARLQKFETSRTKDDEYLRPVDECKLTKQSGSREESKDNDYVSMLASGNVTTLCGVYENTQDVASKVVDDQYITTEAAEEGTMNGPSVSRRMLDFQVKCTSADEYLVTSIESVTKK